MTYRPRSALDTLYTIGTSGKSLREFVETLRGAKIDRVIDTRLRNTSHLAGFSKREDLEFLLGELLGIGFQHEPDLAPTPEILDTFRRDGDWAAYERRFEPLLREREMTRLVVQAAAGAARPCLLCACPSADHCHRRLLAEAVARERPGLRVEHR